MRPLSLLLLVLVAPAAHAQIVMGGMLANAPSTATPGATVTGSILCGDSNTPARLARILLKPAVVDDAAVDQRIDTMMQAQQKAQAQARTRNPNAPAPRTPSPQQQAMMRTSYTRQLNMESERSNSTTADFNGHYVLTGVAPGTYYVHAEMPGYVDALDQFSFDELISSDPETAKRIAQLAPRITIIGTEEQRADIRLERGASITGRILYDDGSPAPGWMVAALPQSKTQLRPGDPNAASGIAMLGSSGINNQQPPRTDDLGNFRITGLAAGDYVVRAMLNSPSPGSKGPFAGGGLNMTFYSGDTFRMAEAKAFNLTTGQTRTGTDITVPLNKLHSIHGSVVAKSDGHSPNSGTVNLSTKADPNFRPYTSLQPDGSFTFYSIPAGDYIVMIGGAGDSHPVTRTIPGGSSTSMQTSRRYGPAHTEVTINDVDLTGITLTVPDAGERPAPAAN